MSTDSLGRRFNILLVCDSYPPVLGGSEIEAQRVSRALILRGHRVRVLCAGGPPMPSQQEWVDPFGVPVSILTRRSSGRWKDVMFAIQVARIIRRERQNSNVIYFLMQGLHVATGFPVARLLRKSIVMKISGSGVIPLMQRSLIGRLELRWIRKWAARLLVLNNGMVEEAISHGFSRAQLTLMPNPVDIDEFEPGPPGEAAQWRVDHGVPANAVVVIYVGRLSAEKGLYELLRGFTHAARSAPDLFLVLVGDGPLRAELESYAGGLTPGSECIRFAGRAPLSEVVRWLQASDIFALTSPSEGFSCALLEAMAVGVAPVVSNIPANLQLVNPDEQGLVVPYDDDRCVGEAFLRLSRDPALRRRLGESARRRVMENFATNRVIELYEKLFEDVVDRKDLQ